jgi:hypothetical protein
MLTVNPLMFLWIWVVASSFQFSLWLTAPPPASDKNASIAGALAHMIKARPLNGREPEKSEVDIQREQLARWACRGEPAK